MSDVDLLDESDPVMYTVKKTDESVKKYIKGKKDPIIILNHLEKFSSLLKEKSTILDVGCGHGRDCMYFEQKGFSVVGIDLSEKMLNESKKVCNSTVLLKMDIREIGKIPWKFDAVWSCAVVHHIPKNQIDELLQSIYNILNKDGILFLSFKIDSEGFVYRKDICVKKFYEKYDEKKFINKLTAFGFKVLESSLEQKEYLWLNIFLKKGVKIK
jgi:cyclopropane fatty-acyl-phospholipid synthase-like methyltransferase